MVKRSRLSRGASTRKSNRLDKIRQSVVLELKDETNSALQRYAKMDDKSLVGNPALALLRTEAREVLAERQKSLTEWKTGELTPEQKAKKGKPLIKRIIEGEQKIAGLIGKGFQEYMKVISGEKAREFEQAIATVGMKPEEKKKAIEAERMRQARAEREQLEEEASFFPGRDVPAHAKEDVEFVRERKALDRDREPMRAQEPEHVKGRREELESEDFSLGKVLPAEKNGEPVKPVPTPPIRKEEKPSAVTVNVNVGGQAQVSPGERRVEMGRDLHDVPELLAEEKMATQREMDMAHEGEGVQDVIAEGRAFMEEEQRELARERKKTFEVD